MEQLGSVIAARLAEWGVDELPLERELFGTCSPDAIAAEVDSWCRAELGAGIARYSFFDASSGSVHGVHLIDGRAVVVKGHRQDVSREYLTAVTELKADLAARRFPAPRPLLGPSPLGTGHITAEEMLLCDGQPRRHDPEIRRALASGLAQFVHLASTQISHFLDVPFPMAVPEGSCIHVRIHRGLTSTPLRAAPNGSMNWRGARVSSSARFPRSSGSSLMATGASKTSAFAMGRYVLCTTGTVCTLDRKPSRSRSPRRRSRWIGVAADSRLFPDPQEISAFIGDYESVRGAPFTADERSALAPAMVASLAYGARCEHADPGRPPGGDDSQRGLLRRLGAGLLDDGLAALVR